MDYSGLTYKYKINRPLTDEERAQQLKQNKRLDVEPLHQLAVIRMNSTYLEMVDKYYAWKGFLTFFSLAIILGIVLLISAMAVWLITTGWETVYAQRHADALLAIAIAIIMSSPFLAVAFWLLRKESFLYTHYPIRLNRKTRMVHVFRVDGTVLSVGWDDVFFTLGKGQMGETYDIRGHILDKDGITVKDSFSLSFSGMVTKDELDNPNKQEGNYVRRYWEFVRRYMDEGPAELIGKVEFIMPIAEKRESATHGFSRLNANWGLLWIPMFPVTVMTWIGRMIAMRTSKIPHWPKEVEQSSAVAPSDPYQRDELNPHPSRPSRMNTTNAAA